MSVIAAVGIAIFFFISDKGIKLVPKVTAVQPVGPSKVRVSWRISNEGSDPAFFRSCTISLGGGGVAGDGIVGPMNIVSLASHIDVSTLVTVTKGSSSSVTAAKTVVVCMGLVNAHSGGK